MMRQAMQLLRSAVAHADQRGGELIRLEATVPSIAEYEPAMAEAMALSGVSAAFELKEKPGIPQVISVEVRPAARKRVRHRGERHDE